MRSGKRGKGDNWFLEKPIIFLWFITIGLQKKKKKKVRGALWEVAKNFRPKSHVLASIGMFWGSVGAVHPRIR